MRVSHRKRRNKRRKTEEDRKAMRLRKKLRKKAERAEINVLTPSNRVSFLDEE